MTQDQQDDLELRAILQKTLKEPKKKAKPKLQKFKLSRAGIKEQRKATILKKSKEGIHIIGHQGKALIECNKGKIRSGS